MSPGEGAPRGTASRRNCGEHVGEPRRAARRCSARRRATAPAAPGVSREHRHQPAHAELAVAGSRRQRAGGGQPEAVALGAEDVDAEPGAAGRASASVTTVAARTAPTASSLAGPHGRPEPPLPVGDDARRRTPTAAPAPAAAPAGPVAPGDAEPRVVRRGVAGVEAAPPAGRSWRAASRSARRAARRSGCAGSATATSRAAGRATISAQVAVGGAVEREVRGDAGDASTRRLAASGAVPPSRSGTQQQAERRRRRASASTAAVGSPRSPSRSPPPGGRSSGTRAGRSTPPRRSASPPVRSRPRRGEQRRPPTGDARSSPVTVAVRTSERLGRPATGSRRWREMLDAAAGRRRGSAGARDAARARAMPLARAGRRGSRSTTSQGRR